MPMGTSAQTVKSREIPAKGDFSSHLVFGSFSPTSVTSTEVFDRFPPDTFMGRQSTASENHPSWRNHVRGSLKGDVGGAFRTVKQWVETPLVSESIAGIDEWPPGWGTYANFSGPVLPLPPPQIAFPPVAESSETSLDAWGASAVAQCKPTNNIADVSTFLGELLREGLPRVIGSASNWKQGTSRAKSAGNEYLNAEFGWKPLVHDIRSIADAIVRAETVLRQYERDSGKVVRRRFSFPSESNVSTERVRDGVSPYLAVSHSNLYWSNINQGSVYRIHTVERERWFSGAFTYYLPSGYDTRSGMARQLAEAKKVLGLSLTPDTVWNLAPWSWAVDWFTNAGDVISNMTDWVTDGLVLRYGYMMEHVRSSYTYTFVGPTGLRSDLQPVPITTVTETKVRRKANPFGFGLTWGGLSPRQLAIAAALGLSRS